MTKKEMLLQIFKEVFETDQVKINQLIKFEGEWDSLRHAELILRFQKKFNRKLTWNEIESIKSFEDFLNIENK